LAGKLNATNFKIPCFIFTNAGFSIKSEPGPFRFTRLQHDANHALGALKRFESNNAKQNQRNFVNHDLSALMQALMEEI